MATSAAFIALAVALGFVLTAVPNVELITLTIFLAGCVLGPAGGAWVGVASWCIYSLLNPWGAPPPLLFAGQILGGTAAGAAGGWLVPLARRRSLPGRGILFAGAGFAVTFLYDVLTNLGIGIQLGAIVPTLMTGLPFSLLHWVNNTVAFVVLGVPSLRVLEHLGRLHGSA